MPPMRGLLAAGLGIAGTVLGSNSLSAPRPSFFGAIAALLLVDFASCWLRRLGGRSFRNRRGSLFRLHGSASLLATIAAWLGWSRLVSQLNSHLIRDRSLELRLCIAWTSRRYARISVLTGCIWH